MVMASGPVAALSPLWGRRAPVWGHGTGAGRARHWLVATVWWQLRCPTQLCLWHGPIQHQGGFWGAFRERTAAVSKSEHLLGMVLLAGHSRSRHHLHELGTAPCPRLAQPRAHSHKSLGVEPPRGVSGCAVTSPHRTLGVPPDCSACYRFSHNALA